MDGWAGDSSICPTDGRADARTRSCSIIRTARPSCAQILRVLARKFCRGLELLLTTGSSHNSLLKRVKKLSARLFCRVRCPWIQMPERRMPRAKFRVSGFASWFCICWVAHNSPGKRVKNSRRVCLAACGARGFRCPSVACQGPNSECLVLQVLHSGFALVCMPRACHPAAQGGATIAQQSEATPWLPRQGEQRPCMGRTIPTDCGTPSGFARSGIGCQWCVLSLYGKGVCSWLDSDPFERYR